MGKPDISGALVAESILAPAQKKKRQRKAVLLTQVDIEETAVVKSENEDLNLHVSLCEQRYKELERRLDSFDERLTALENNLSQVKVEMSRGFGEIKLLLEQRNTQKQTQLIAATATTITALIALIGYIITRS
jgi:chromosome segregation ATPase